MQDIGIDVELLPDVVKQIVGNNFVHLPDPPRIAQIVEVDFKSKLMDLLMLPLYIVEIVFGERVVSSNQACFIGMWQR